MVEEQKFLECRKIVVVFEEFFQNEEAIMHYDK